MFSVLIAQSCFRGINLLIDSNISVFNVFLYNDLPRELEAKLFKRISSWLGKLVPEAILWNFPFEFFPESL